MDKYMPRVIKIIKSCKTDEEIRSVLDEVYEDGANNSPDTELVDWLNDHAILLGVIKDDGKSEYVKVEGATLCFRDIALSLKVIAEAKGKKRKI